MPRERPTPAPFEDEELERSLNRYLVLGLGDGYLGAPVTVPIDPRHRLAAELADGLGAADQQLVLRQIELARIEL